MDTITLAKQAYSGFVAQATRRAGNPQARRSRDDYRPYIDLLAQDVVLKCSAPLDTPMGVEVHGKAAVMQFAIEKTAELIEDIHLQGPLEYIGRGAQVVILGAESYNIRATGVCVRNNQFLAILDFDNGLIVRHRLSMNMAELVDACRSRGGHA